LSDASSIRRSSAVEQLPGAGGPAVRASAVTAIASLSVDAAGTSPVAFHAAPAPGPRFST
jgi:hypothetical protein